MSFPSNSNDIEFSNQFLTLQTQYFYTTEKAPFFVTGDDSYVRNFKKWTAWPFHDDVEDLGLSMAMEVSQNGWFIVLGGSSHFVSGL